MSFSHVRTTMSFERAVMWFSSGMVDAKGLALGFVLGFFIRLVPELLAFTLPIGFDVVNYAVVMKNGVVWPHWSSFFTSTWLFYALTVPLYGFSKVDPFLLLKIVSPLIYGLNVVGVYWFARKMLNWNAKLSLVAAVFFAVQLASLRISWDLLRNTLGLGLLLFALSYIGRLGSRKEFAFFAFLSLLTVFAHEYAAVTLLTIVLVLIVWRSFRKKADRSDGLSFLGVLPALTVFSAGMFLRFFPVKYVVQTNVISTGEASSGRFMFFANYLAINDLVFHYPTYWNLLVDVSLLFAFLYLSYLFLVWKGFFRSEILSVWTGLLFFGSFGCLVFPFWALDYWSRWMFMLVYPFTFYATNSLHTILKSSNNGNRRFEFFSNKTIFGAFGATALLGSFYLATPVLMSTSNVGVFALPSVSAHFSSAPTVPYQDVDGVVQAMDWLNANMDGGSCVILNHVFLPWGRLYLDKSHVMVHFWNDVDVALSLASDRDFSRVYLVWWNEDIGWYVFKVPDGFTEVFRAGRISVFEYSR